MEDSGGGVRKVEGLPMQLLFVEADLHGWTRGAHSCPADKEGLFSKN